MKGEAFIMSNRIKELRKEKGLSIRKLSDCLKEKGVSLSADSISKYERGERTPKIENWQKLADFFEVPVPYITGESSHRDGLDLWAKNTGYSMQEIQREVERLEKANRFKDENRQQRIGQAVANLGGWGANDEYHAVINLAHSLRKMVQEYLKPYFYDLEAMAKQPDKPLSPGSKIMLDKKPIFFDDMHPETLKKVDEIIGNAAAEIEQLAFEIRRNQK